MNVQKNIKKTKRQTQIDYDTLEEILSGTQDPARELTYARYKDLLNRRIILINGDIEENVIERVVALIDQMSTEHPKTPITIWVNSYGGSLYDGMAVVDAIRSTKTPITTIALGKAMSAAFNIFLAGDLRIVRDNSILLAHCGSQEMGEIKLSDISDEGEYNNQLFDRFANYYASRTKIPKKEWLDLMKSGKDRYFFPDEAIKMGIAHQLEGAQTQKYYPKAPKSRKLQKRKKGRSRTRNKRKSR